MRRRRRTSLPPCLVASWLLIVVLRGVGGWMWCVSSWPSNVNVVVKGFVKNMDSWMGASDVIVTKAGPGQERAGP